MQVANSFRENYQIDNFAPSALYELAAPSTPQAARNEALERAKAGEAITYTAAKAIKQKYTAPPTKPKPQPQPQPEPISQPQPTPTPVLPTQLGAKKLEIVAIRSSGQAAILAATNQSTVTQTAQIPSVSQLSSPVFTPAPPGVGGS